MKRIILMGLVAMGCAAFAQVQKTDEEKLVVYKWYQKGRAHYAKVPPHGVTNYVKLNEYGIVITDRPAEDEFSSSVLRAVRPAGKNPQITPATPGSQPAAAPAAAATANAAVQPAPGALPEGTITREERCKTAQNDLNVMNTKKNVYEEDSNGNLVPLSAEAIESRKAQAQQEISSHCN